MIIWDILKIESHQALHQCLLIVKIENTWNIQEHQYFQIQNNLYKGLVQIHFYVRLQIILIEIQQLILFITLNSIKA